MKVGHSDICPLPQFQWTNQAWKTQRTAKDTDVTLPCSRSQHACCLQGQHIFLLGGRDGYSPLKDFWKMDIGCGKWENIVVTGTKLPHLQGHTMVAYKSQIFIFGGTFEETPDDTPLWIYSHDLNYVRKYVCEPPLSHPMGRREHSAVVHNNCMYIYGGFMDNSGSIDEFWAFNMEEEEWCPLPRPKPGKRHGHISVVHHNALWVHGGMKGLERLADIWMYNFDLSTWKRLKGSGVCPALSYHTGHIIDNVLILVGGSLHSVPSSAVWLYGIENNTWRQVEVDESHLFTSVCLHTSVLIDLKVYSSDKKDKQSQSTPHLKSHFASAVTPSVRPWTSPPFDDGSTQLHVESESYSEVNILNLESFDKIALDKNNNSEENLFSCVKPISCYSKDSVENVKYDEKWQCFVDKNICPASRCELNELTDVNYVQQFKLNSTKIQPSSFEQCQDDLPLLERFVSVGSSVDLGESNVLITLSDENICEESVEDNIKHKEKGDFQFDNLAFIPAAQSNCPGEMDRTKNVSSQTHHQEFLRPNNKYDLHSNVQVTSNERIICPPSPLSESTVDESSGFTRSFLEHHDFCSASSKTLSMSPKSEKEFGKCVELIELKMKTWQSFNDLILEDLESCEVDSVLNDVSIAFPVNPAMKCSSLKDVSSIGSSFPEKNYSSPHPFCVDSPVKKYSKSCCSVDIRDVNNESCGGSLKKINSLSVLLSVTPQINAKEPVYDLRMRKTGKYTKRQTYQNPFSLEQGKPNTNSILQKKINLKKSAPTQLDTLSSITSKDSNPALVDSLKQENEDSVVNKNCSEMSISESSTDGVECGLSVFSDSKFVLLVLGGKTDAHSFIKTPLTIWKCKVF